jgi:hypothetical protein
MTDSDHSELDRVARELTAGERDVLADDIARWKRMGAGSHLDEWLAFGTGLMIRRRLAMRMAYTNRPEGRGYNERFSAVMTRDGFYDGDPKTKTAWTAVIWLHDKPEHLQVLREIRDAMKPAERARLNSPITARQHVERVLKARACGIEEKIRVSPVAKYKRTIAEHERTIKELQTTLAAPQQRDGSLFDLKRDNAEDIGRVLAEHVSEQKFRNIVTAATKQYKKKHRPAG